ncbi:hypothetical protein Tco_0722368 [Tanacetum coccineum]
MRLRLCTQHKQLALRRSSLEGMDDDDDDGEVPLVEGVLMGAFLEVQELGLLKGGGVMISLSLVKSMINGFSQMGFTVILGFL